MNDIAVIALGAGLKDGLNPCIFITCAIFIIQGFWFTTNSLGIFWVRIIFGLVYMLGFLFFNFGPGQILTLQKIFVLSAKILYFVLGAGSFVIGVLFFKDWLSLRRGQQVQELPVRSKKFPALATGALTAILSFVLSSLATLWPIDNYIFILGNEGVLKGRWQMVMPLLLDYVFVAMWALWFIWAFLSIKDLRPSFLRILCAAIFFTASSSMIFIFK
jgi:hypothetical protein